MCVCVLIHVRMTTLMQACKYTCVCMHAYVCVCGGGGEWLVSMCVHACVCIYAHACMCEEVCKCIIIFHFRVPEILVEMINCCTVVAKLFWDPFFAVVLSPGARTGSSPHRRQDCRKCLEFVELLCSLVAQAAQSKDGK